MYTFRLVILFTFLSFSFKASAQWESIADYPSAATDGAFSFTIDNIGYVGGGISNNRFYSFDPENNTWTKLADVPGPGSYRGWAFSFSINGKGYVCGGSYNGASNVSNDLWEYDPATGKWTKKADFPGGGRDGGFSFALNGKAYVGGGFDGQFLRADVYKYDPENDSWEQLDDYPDAQVIFPAAFVAGGKAYVGTGDNGTSESNNFYAFDGYTEEWTQVADFPGDARQTAVGFGAGDIGFIGGGMSGYKVTYTDFWEYNTANNTWKKIDDGDFPNNTTAWTTAFAINGTAYMGLGVDFPDFTFTKKFYKKQFASTVAIHETSVENKVKFYPNPAKNIIQLETDILPTEVKIMDVSGKVLSTYGQNKTINVQHLPAGLYLLQINTIHGVQTQKFIKE